MIDLTIEDPERLLAYIAKELRKNGVGHAIPRKRYAVPAYDWKSISSLFPQEESMYITEDYEIRERLESCRPKVSLDVRGLHALPPALRRLAEMGHDMTPSLETLQDACEEQRKRKALDAAIADLTKKPEKA